MTEKKWTEETDVLFDILHVLMEIRNDQRAINGGAAKTTVFHDRGSVYRTGFERD